MNKDDNVSLPTADEMREHTINGYVANQRRELFRLFEKAKLDTIAVNYICFTGNLHNSLVSELQNNGFQVDYHSIFGGEEYVISWNK